MLMLVQGTPLSPGKLAGIVLMLLLPGMLSCGESRADGPDGTSGPINSIVEAARNQVGVTVTYDPAYVALSYPGGDLPRAKGVCSDVVIRALREGKKMDLQKLVHEDMKSNFAKYPKIWGLRRTDRNIDHRRVPNLRTYLTRKGCAVPVTKKAGDYHPGDLVTCTVPPNLPHIMIVSDRRSSRGIPLVIHNIGRGTREENLLFTYPLTGHYRVQ
ncbi:MAG: DUF1287 domain-containing protein [Roseibacillus sp.]|jgi:hypothetical protein|nr:DUF1287 domain-containing protein [Roseibacillus sp.]MBP34808.1 DUF1287 domain-containing protein [Roseibacillus sp.]MCP4730263.1 DUF1287 domain-containing protein [Roseibacillus sp.]MDP7306298.1 DUF1287 domain-containing protein [Roseibacillus sp.]|tara:strand:- start:527 stop:1168 length:642 start_codon:yes stop_codon:yes gene_type:complete